MAVVCFLLFLFIQPLSLIEELNSFPFKVLIDR